MTTFKGKLLTPSYDPGSLEWDTNYYWVVDEFSPSGTVAGPVWSFWTMSGPEKATNPYPADGAEDVPIDVALSWTAGFGATSHDVHFGTSSSPPFIGNQIRSDYNPGTLEPCTYWWYIDTVVQMDEISMVYPGDLWSFTTMSGPEKATNPYPADGAEDVPLDIVLSWDTGYGATSQDVYLGTSSSPMFIGNQTASMSDYNPGGLEPDTRYWWQIDAVRQTDEFFMVYTGDLWSFTTDLDTDEHTDFECFFYQMDFNLSGTAYIDTEWGSVDFTFAGQEPIMYFNLTVNGTWQVQNIPVLSIEGVGVDQTMTYYFDLGTARGTNVTSLNYDFTFTPNILDTMPGLFKPALVADDYIAMWPGFGGSMPPLAPAKPLIGGEVVNSDEKYAHKDFPNQECAPNECTPTAVSNSLQFLNKRHGLGMDPNKITIDEMKKAVGWDPNGAPWDWWRIKKKYMEDNDYPITTRKITDINELGAEMLDGQDIEINESWRELIDPNGDPNDPNNVTIAGHTTALIGITPLKNGKYSLDVADDRKQGEPGGCDNPRTYIYDPNDPKGTFCEIDPNDPNGTFYTNFDHAVVECPSYILLDDFELYDDDFGNRIFETWKDGYGYGDIELGYPGNGTGSAVNIDSVTVYEGTQSMRVDYDNGGFIWPKPIPPQDPNRDPYDPPPDPNKPSIRKAFYSEAERTFDAPQDWARCGVTALSLWFYGDLNNDSEPMYVAVEDTTGMSAVVVHEDTDATLIETWQGWTICLEQFTGQGVNLTDVSSIAIGFGDRHNPQPGGIGTVYFDDITLCTDPCPIADGSVECKVEITGYVNGREVDQTSPSPWTFKEKAWKPIERIHEDAVVDDVLGFVLFGIWIDFEDGDYFYVKCIPGLVECKLEFTLSTSKDGMTTVTVTCTARSWDE
jgi:hypothetical protein